MTLLHTIKQDRDVARINKKAHELAVLKLLLGEIEKEEKARPAGTELADAEVEAVVSRQLKKLQDEKEQYKALNQPIDKQEEEEKILLSYLPKQLTHDELVAYVNEAIEKAKAGIIKNEMQYLSPELKGKANMKEVAQLVQQLKGK